MSSRGGSYRHIHQLRAEVNRLIDLLLDEPTSPTPSWQPPLDLVERGEAYEVLVELPGVRGTELHVELRDQVLLVRGTKQRLAGEPPGRRFHLMERYMGSFQVSVELPRPILPSQSTASLRQGVLVVTLPKVTERRHRCYSITVVEEPSNHD